MQKAQTQWAGAPWNPRIQLREKEAASASVVPCSSEYLLRLTRRSLTRAVQKRSAKDLRTRVFALN